MSDTSESTPIDVTIANSDNLDTFAAGFFGESTDSPSDNAKSEEIVEEVEADDSDAPKEQTETEDTQSADEGATDEEADNTDESEENDSEDETNKGGKKPNRFQERINEVVAARRQAERERDELKRKLEELSNPTTKSNDKPVEAQQQPTEVAGPSPNDKNEDGTEKYPLGEFDPKFVKDTVQHMLNQELQSRKAQEAQQEKITEEQRYRANLQDSWNEKLSTAQERYPDFTEKGEQMLSVFEGIDDSYGQYLTDTLMEMDAGPEVFYYLANNLDEAETIVNAGPRKATIALAKLEAQLAGSPVPKTPTPKVTNAPKPPPQLKGSAAAKASIPLDTDDLDAFSKVLFKKK